MGLKLRLSGAQYRELRGHLFPGDGLEAVAVALCGRRAGEDDSEPGLVGRWRATLAHEASHVLMHRVLFELATGQESLFQVAAPAGAKLMRCLKKNVLFRAGGSDSREVQANMGMAALLMPERFFASLVAEIVRESGIESAALVAGSAPAEQLATLIRDRCAVSKQAALIRLETTRIVSPRGQTRFSAPR